MKLHAIILVACVALASCGGNPPAPTAAEIAAASRAPVKEYQIIEKSSAAEMQDAVNKLVHEGWRPIGGINVVLFTGDRGMVYTQAIAK